MQSFAIIRTWSRCVNIKLFSILIPARRTADRLSLHRIRIYEGNDVKMGTNIFLDCCEILMVASIRVSETFAMKRRLTGGEPCA